MAIDDNTKYLFFDWSWISDVDQLIVIDCYRLLLIVIDYQFHRLIRLGSYETKTSDGLVILNLDYMYDGFTGKPTISIFRYTLEDQ